MNLLSNNYSSDLKLRIIKLYKDKTYSVSELVNIFKVSQSSIYNWIKLYKNNKLEGKKEYNKKTSNFRNEKIRKIIIDYLNKNPNFIKNKLLIHIFKLTNIQIKKTLLYKIIKNLEFSKKNSKI